MLQFMNMDMSKGFSDGWKLLSPTENRVLKNIIGEIYHNRISEDLAKCIVKYENIEHHIGELKRKSGGDPLLEKGIDNYISGNIILFNGELTSYDQYKLPPFLLFIPFKDKILFNINGMRKTNWKKVGTNSYEYTFSSPLIELKFILVTAQIMYEILVMKKENVIVNDQKLMTLVSQSYVDFFKKAVGRIGASIDEWDKDKLNYVLSKFFYIHVLEFSPQEADKIVANMYNYVDYEIADIRLSEELIDYSSLEKFIPSMTKLFYKKETIAQTIINSWFSSFGATVITEIEYLPALITHLLVLIFGVEFVNGKQDLRSRKDVIYQRLTVLLK